MKLNLPIVAVACSLALLAACTKKEDEKKNDDNKNLSPTGQLLVAGKWQMTASTATATYMGADTTIDLYSQMPDCDKDDFILFAANGTATIDENTNKCPDDSQVENGTWALLNNDTKLALVDSNPDTFDVEVSSTEFKIKLTSLNSSGIPVTYKDTYKNIK